VRTLQALRTALAPGGRLILYVPQGPGLFSPLDERLGRRRRYDAAELGRQLEQGGLRLRHCQPFNRAGTLGWWLNGRLLRRTHVSRLQRKVFDVLVPLLKRVDRFLPLPALGLVAVAAVPQPGTAEEGSEDARADATPAGLAPTSMQRG
jgi:hypothetical protein